MLDTLKRHVRSRLPETLWDAMAQVRFELKTASTARRAKSRFQDLRERTNLKVNIGAGDDIRPGWVNVDLAVRFPTGFDLKANPDTIIINYDLRRGLPLAENSCSYIYSSHFFEHLDHKSALRLMRDCHSALHPGGTFRMALPNFPKLFEAYLARDEAYFDLLNLSELVSDIDADALSLVDHVNYGVYQSGEHKCVYDEEKAVRMLRVAGFGSASPAGFREGTDPSSPLRRRYSFYVEAMK